MGFGAEGQPALTQDEIYILVDSADKNGDGEIDFKEFVDRFLMAAQNEPQYDRNAQDLKGVPSSQSTWLAQGLDRRVASSIIYFDGDDAPATFGGFADEVGIYACVCVSM